MRRRYLLLVLFASVIVLVAGCSSAAVPATSAPTQAAAQTSSSSQSVAATPVPTQVAATITAPTAVPPTAVAKPTMVPTAVATSKPGVFGKAELNQIFPPGKGQDLVFRACVNCHNWVPLVMAGFDKGGWQQNMKNHRERVSGLSDEEFSYLYDYLAQALPAGHPVPTNIPKDLLDSWTSY